MQSGLPPSGSGGLWAHPPLPPGKRILGRGDSSDGVGGRKSSVFGGFMRKFPSVRRGRVAKNDNKVDTCTYTSFDSDLFDDSEIVCAGRTADERDDDNRLRAGGYDDEDDDENNVRGGVFDDRRDDEDERIPPFVMPLFRSRSDGNLTTSVGSLRTRQGSVSSQESSAETNRGLSRYLRALNGSWKNLLNISSMNKTQKNVPQVKKVPPPAIPDSVACRNSGSSFGSTGYSSSSDDAFLDPNTCIKPDIYDAADTYCPIGNKSPSSQYNHTAFTFPGSTSYHHSGGNMKMYYHQLSLQEDQGIDMTQSPGRDSPGSSGSGSGSRHSTASLDSGRASGCHLRGNSHWPPELSPSTRVERLLNQGVPDKDIMYSWLVDLHLEEYLPLFLSAGYDMRTVSKMTPEDLTAIGVKKPNHRKKLKAEIGLLNISDGLLDYIPGSLDEWLRLLRLEEYGSALEAQGYSTIDDVTQLTWEDLEDIGIVKLGHQKRLILAIKRVKDIKAGKSFVPHSPYIIQTQACIESPLSIVSSSSGCGTSITNMSSGTGSVELDFPRVHAMYYSFHQPWELESSKQLYCQTDIVPIKLRGSHRGKSLESLNENTSTIGGTSSFVGPPQWRHQQKSFEDGDLTPTNETTILHECGGTLPRPRGLVKPRLVAKVPALFSQPNIEDCSSGLNTLKRRPPSPPKRQQSIEDNSKCHQITVVADLHCVPTLQSKSLGKWTTDNMSPKHNLEDHIGSNASFKSNSSTESDTIPFANENAGTIKQRTIRSTNELIQPMPAEGSHSMHTTTSYSMHSTTTSQFSLMPSSGKKEPADVLNDIGNMLANLTDELDAMLEEEKRQGLND